MSKRNQKTQMNEEVNSAPSIKQEFDWRREDRQRLFADVPEPDASEFDVQDASAVSAEHSEEVPPKALDEDMPVVEEETAPEEAPEVIDQAAAELEEEAPAEEVAPAQEEPVEESEHFEEEAEERAAEFVEEESEQEAPAEEDKSEEEEHIEDVEEETIEAEPVVEEAVEDESVEEAEAEQADEENEDVELADVEEEDVAEEVEGPVEDEASEPVLLLDEEVMAEAEPAEETSEEPSFVSAVEVEKPHEEEEDIPLLRVVNLKEWFPIKTSIIKSKNVYLKAVDGVSFSLRQGKTIGIVGESGCGKTTLGRTILRLYEPTSGEIIFEGKHIEKLKGERLRKIRPNFQMIFQDPYSSLSPRLTVGEIVGEAVRTHKIVPKSEYKDYIVDIMLKCGLQPHYFERYPHEFSGGQRQRICIAKALALKPKLVICDEPVSALDVSIQAQVINLFKDLQESDNLAYIFISHDLSVVEHISDEVGVMYLGNMVEFGSKKELFSNPMHPYTQALFSAVPIPDPDKKIKRIILQGDIPSPAHPPKGCKFHTRCSRCMDICREVEPKFIDYGNGHCVACHLYSQEGDVVTDPSV